MSRSFQLLASALAVFGLNGQGFAMLLVALVLPQNAAAQHGFPNRIEICSPQGLITIELTVARQASGSKKPSFPGSGPKPAKYDPCPVCAVFAQAGAADLPQTAAYLEPYCGTASWLDERRRDLPAAARLPANTRAPPAAA